MNVQDDGVRLLLLHHAHSLIRLGRRVDTEPDALQIERQRAVRVLVVFDDQDDRYLAYATWPAP